MTGGRSGLPPIDHWLLSNTPITQCPGVVGKTGPKVSECPAGVPASLLGAFSVAPLNNACDAHPVFLLRSEGQKKTKFANMLKWCRRADPALTHALGRTRSRWGAGRNITSITSSSTRIASIIEQAIRRRYVLLNVRYA